MNFKSFIDLIRLFIFIFIQNIDQDVILFTLECPSALVCCQKKQNASSASSARFARNDRTIQLKRPHDSAPTTA